MEETVVEYVLTAMRELAASYPDAAWTGIALGVALTLCGIAAVVTIWLPAPTQTGGWYAAADRWLHAMAGHVGQNGGAVADADNADVRAAVRAVTGK